jgi:hypothetical protein
MITKPCQASGSIGPAVKAKQQDNGRRDGKQAGGRCEMTNGRRSAIRDTTSRVGERQPAKRTHDHEREQRPPPRPGPLHEKTNPEDTCPTSSKGDAEDQRRQEAGFELIPRPGTERDPERREADCSPHEGQSCGHHGSAPRNPSHGYRLPESNARRTVGQRYGTPRTPSAIRSGASRLAGHDYATDWLRVVRLGS